MDNTSPLITGIPAAPTDMSASNSTTCNVSGCNQTWISLIPTRQIKPSLEIALTNNDELKEVLALCRKHLRALRRADGVVLGYRMRNGKLRAYIKDEFF